MFGIELIFASILIQISFYIENPESIVQIPYFVKIRGPVFVRFSVSEFPESEATVRVTNFIILTALFKAVTGTRPWLRFCVTERNREPTFF